MSNSPWNEKVAERRVTYTLAVNDHLFVIENVPARVDLETGEQLFSPETVEHLQHMVAQRRKPKRVLQVPAYEYA